MGKADDSKDKKQMDPQTTSDEAQPEADTEGQMYLPRDPGTARALASDRMRDVERGVRDKSLEKDARNFKQGRR